MTVFTEQRKEESLTMLCLKHQQQLVTYRLEVGKKRNRSMKAQRLYMSVTRTQQWIWEGEGNQGLSI